MRVEHIEIKQASAPITVMDCDVEKGLVEGSHAAMPDIDVDYASERRQEMKEYLEERYNIDGKQRVFSAGTFSTMKLKAVLKDVARVHRIPHSLVNYITAIFEDDSMSWTDLFRLAATNKKVNKFIQDYPQVIEDIRGLLNQPRSTSIHASAIIVTPAVKDGKEVECFDFLPIRKMDGLLVSEFDGYTVDEIGLLKEDVLSTKELSKLSGTIQAVNQVYGKNFSIESITRDELADPKTYQLLSDGYTQNVFQFASKGITRFIMDVRPDCIEDLIAINALYRPATLEINATEDYVRYKRGDVAPVYNYGCYEATRNTYGIMCIAENSTVVTDRGNKLIQEIKPDDRVLTEDGSYHRVHAVIPKGRKDTIRVRTSFGEELRCTIDHRVLTQYGWVEAGKLVPEKHLIKAFWTQPENKNIGDMKDWCLGLYLANGSSVSYPATIACRNKRGAEIIKGIFDKEFNLSSTVYFHVRCWYVRLTASNCSNGLFSKTYKKNEFNQYLKDQGLKGVNVYNKRMPDNPSLMLLTGFIERDGCISNKTIRLCNKGLAMGLYNGLQAHRIPCRYHESLEKGNIVCTVSYNEHPECKLNFTLKDKTTVTEGRSSGVLVPSAYLKTVQLDKQPISVRSNIKKAMSSRYKAFRQTVEKDGGWCEHRIWAEVLSVKQDHPSNTWDLSVDNNHSFCVGGLIVHNCYQEQFMSIAHTLAGFDLGKTDYLRKAIGKKNAELMATLKTDFVQGAIDNGCPGNEAEEIWHKIEVAGKYSFNRSHAAAYALTAFCGAWLKANYPTAFYTVALQWADDKEIPLLMSEMEQCSQAKIVPPDINVSEVKFFTDYQADTIFWSLTRIKMLGAKTVEYIIEERERGGNFTSIENFIHRIFRYKLRKYTYWDDPDNAEEAIRVPVNARHVKNMVLAGCFDSIEQIGAVTDRYGIAQRAATELGFVLPEKDFPGDLLDKHYYWSMQQIAVSGIGSIDYRRIFDASGTKAKVRGKASYMEVRDALDLDNEGKRIVVCATVTEVEEKSYKDKTSGEKKKFAKLTLQQNNDLIELVCWSDFLGEFKIPVTALKDKVIIATVVIKYSDYNGANSLNTYKSSIIEQM